MLVLSMAQALSCLCGSNRMVLSCLQCRTCVAEAVPLISGIWRTKISASTTGWATILGVARSESINAIDEARDIVLVPLDGQTHAERHQ